MKNKSEGQFDQELLDIFFENVIIYPNTVILKTSVGYGIVKKSLKGQTLRPIIVVFADKNINLISEPYMVDLFKESWIKIEDVIEEQKQIELTEQLEAEPIEFLNQNYPMRSFLDSERLAFA